MNKHFIKNIEIKNFKCFEEFKAEGFGRVNLIGGKNNVGKSAFMEAIYIDTSSNTMNNLLFSIANIERNRNKINDKETNIIDILTDYATFFIKGKNDIQYDVNLSGIEKHLKIKLNKKSEDIDFKSEINFISNKKVTFIDNYGFTNYELKSAFEAVQKKDKEDILDQYINQFDKNILKFKIIGGDKPQCRTSEGNYQDITKFGDGLKQYISIICSLYATQNSFLFIDEIENGIHYTNLDRLWEIILTISKEQNVQVFATTHSKECIESYARVAKELKDEEIGFIELGRNKKNELDSIVMNSERFQRYIKLGNEVRGW
ncbi:MAG: AAA family ATPase [Campylobacterota bacterium]|nr:AAA family ATPase [Campylobacterota bacterium]